MLNTGGEGESCQNRAIRATPWPRPSSAIEPATAPDLDTLTPRPTPDPPTSDPPTPPDPPTRTRRPPTHPPSQLTGQSRHPLSSSGTHRQHAVRAVPCPWVDAQLIAVGPGRGGRGGSCKTAAGRRFEAFARLRSPTQRSPQPRGAFTPSVWRKARSLRGPRSASPGSGRLPPQLRPARWSIHPSILDIGPAASRARPDTRLRRERRVGQRRPPSPGEGLCRGIHNRSSRNHRVAPPPDTVAA